MYPNRFLNLSSRASRFARSSLGKSCLLAALIVIGLSMRTGRVYAEDLQAATSEPLTDEGDLQLARQATEQPRQSFKVHILDRSSTRSSKSKLLRDKLEKGGNRRRSTSSNSDQRTQTTSNISSASLKKLLSQVAAANKLNSTPPTLSNSSTSGQQQLKSSNFKFVFLQKASNKQEGDKGTASSISNSTTASSLAASISKQLAESLLYSAASLLESRVSNGSLSLSSLASQLASKSSSTKSPQVETESRTTVGRVKSLKDNISEKGSDSEPSEANALSSADNIEQLGSAKSGSFQLSSTSPTKSTASSTLKASGFQSKRRPPGPSRIYNLPVQFVSNGQPTRVVFNTLKQHLANMKKLQQVAASSGLNAAPLTKRKKGPTKVKANPRLIYLPLRYFNNGKVASVTVIKSPSIRGHSQRLFSATKSKTATTTTSATTSTMMPISETAN